MKTTAERAGGWGDAGPDGLITGGEGGDTLYFNESTSVNGKIGFNALWETILLNLATPLQLVWTGNDTTLDPINYVIGQTNSFVNRPIHKSIIGSNGQVLTGGSIIPVGWRNIIVRNLIRRGDGLGSDDNIPHGGKGFGFRFCERIWIDHCEMDGEALSTVASGQIKDGSLDIYRQSNYVTVSNCYIRRSVKTALHGESDTATDDEGKLKITYRNCLWENNHSRQPFVRFGQVHLLNCGFKYVPVFTNSSSQYDWARIIELGFKAQIYSQGCVYRGHRYFLKDNKYLEGEDSLSGFVSDGDFYDPSPTFSSFSNGSVSGEYKGYGSLRTNRVSFNPNEIVGYNYPVPLQTTESQVMDYLELWAGAKYHLIDGGFSLNLSTTTGGTATRDPASGTIEQNATVILTATPSSGFVFSRWQNVLTGQVLSQNSTYNHVMLADISIVAVFVSDVPVDPDQQIKIKMKFQNNIT